MDYQKALDFLYGCLPQFQRIGAAAYKAGLDTTMALDDALGNPHCSYKVVHVGGTNGKGSTSQMIYEALRCEGHSVGLYTSPHLVDFRERIIVDGEMITCQAVVDFVMDNMLLFEEFKPSFFEVTVAMALWWFRECGVDWAVVEVGMGGRLDSTNIVVPELSVITNISMDHTQFLGNTIEKIAEQKAGIIKPGVGVVVGQTHEGSSSVFSARAMECGSRILFADRQEAQPYLCGMGGWYQRFNAQTAYVALMELGVSNDAIRQGIQGARVRGRWQVLDTEPLVLCDTAHNEAGLKEVVSQLVETAQGGQIYFVLGVVNDKDLGSILPLLPTSAHYIITAPSIPRALPAVELYDAVVGYNLSAELSSSVEDAIGCARGLANRDDTVFIGGSTFMVADALVLQKRRKKERKKIKRKEKNA